MDTKSKCKIVYADDAMIHHVMMKAMAQSHSLELVYCASNGRDLIDYLIEHNKALPEVCILDLHMPILNGIETAKIVRDKFPSIRIFGLTSSSDESERIEMLAGGVEQIFAKEDMSALLQQL
ncbi:response regulator [Sphingobacterium sp. ML3W]|uniref:response regulator transcription factor n=1 Tax=Sphingobacterium sp. ML3W TaxID=1538644 RepID=UPI00249CE05A|nr:response regulator [Sphingobacterium sp. ML3W]WFA81683.1 response regulator [Sphingobacterium sp. ML3W]